MNSSAPFRPKPRPPVEPTKASKQIDVRHLELFLLWPVFLQKGRADSDISGDELPANFLNGWVRLITDKTKGSTWEIPTEPYPPLKGDNAAQAYSEFVYFHPFVRQFLYTTRDDIRATWKQRQDAGHAWDPKGSTWDQANSGPDKLKKQWHDLLKDAINRNLRILTRNDIKTITVKYQWDGVLWTTTFEVKAAWLYLFDTQIALAELRLLHARTTRDGQPVDLKLDCAMKVMDKIRRAFAAYWVIRTDVKAPDHAAGAPGPAEIEATHHTAGDHCPLEVEMDRGEKVKTTARYGTFKAKGDRDKAFQGMEFQGAEDVGQVAEADLQREHVYVHREQYANALWRDFMHPILPTQMGRLGARAGEKEDLRLHFEQIEDERVPIFAYISVDQPREITQGDWMRLAHIDDDGESHCEPYSPQFSNQEKTRAMFYDRFWHPTGEKPAQMFHQTRWLFCGSGFVGVGPAEGFFADAFAGALAHFRHHYFALGMIAHFHRASLLRYKHALAEAAEKLHQDDGAGSDSAMREFKRTVESLQLEFLRFRSRYWFAEVSNQLQGREMFDLWKTQLNTPDLFRDVSADIEAAVSVLRRWDEDQRNSILMKIAYSGAAFAIIAPSLDAARKSISDEGWWVVVLATLFAFSGVFATIFCPRKMKRLTSLLLCTAIFFLCIGAIWSVGTYLYIPDWKKTIGTKQPLLNEEVTPPNGKELPKRAQTKDKLEAPPKDNAAADGKVLSKKAPLEEKKQDPPKEKPAAPTSRRSVRERPERDGRRV